MFLLALLLANANVGETRHRDGGFFLEKGELLVVLDSVTYYEVGHSIHVRLYERKDAVISVSPDDFREVGTGGDTAGVDAEQFEEQNRHASLSTETSSFILLSLPFGGGFDAVARLLVKSGLPYGRQGLIEIDPGRYFAERETLVVHLKPIQEQRTAFAQALVEFDNATMLGDPERTEMAITLGLMTADRASGKVKGYRSTGFLPVWPREALEEGAKELSDACHWAKKALREYGRGEKMSVANFQHYMGLAQTHLSACDDYFKRALREYGLDLATFGNE